MDRKSPVLRPVALQARPDGATPWQTVLKFDAGDADAEEHVRLGVEELGSVDGGALFRIVSCELPPFTLLVYSAEAGWRKP